MLNHEQTLFIYLFKFEIKKSHYNFTTQVMNARIEDQYSSHEAIKVAHVAIRCLSAEQKYRLIIEEVVRSLEQLQNCNDKTMVIAQAAVVQKNMDKVSINLEFFLLFIPTFFSSGSFIM